MIVPGTTQNIADQISVPHDFQDDERSRYLWGRLTLVAATTQYGRMEAVMDERTFVDTHGVEIFTRWWTIDAPRGVVLISHGASEHSGRYDRFARALNQAGFGAVALDH